MNPGDRIRLTHGGVENEGVLMPSSTPAYLVVKLDGGYNIGVDRDEATVEVLESDVYDVDDSSD